MVQRQHKGKGGPRTRNAPFMSPRIPGAVYLNAALMRLPAPKVKKEEKNMCNLSQKEGSSLLAVLAESERKTLPKNLPLHAETLFFFSFWPLDAQFRKPPHRLNKKRANEGGGGPTRHTALQVEVAT